MTFFGVETYLGRDRTPSHSVLPVPQARLMDTWDPICLLLPLSIPSSWAPITSGNIHISRFGLEFIQTRKRKAVFLHVCTLKSGPG